MKKLPFLSFIAVVVIALSCNTTKITSSWREPNKTVYLNSLKKVLVVAFFKDETSRHKAEDQMSSFLNGNGLQSYKYWGSSFNKNHEKDIRAKIRGDGFDGAVTMRLIDVEKEKTYTSRNTLLYPNYYRSFSDYYIQNWGYHSNNGYFTTTKIYTIETNVFSIKEDRIIWTGLTKTTNPAGVDKLMAEVSHVVYKKMLKEGFVREK